MSKKQTSITIETREVWIIRRPEQAVCGWCGGCAAWVETVTPEEAAQLTGLGVRAIFRLLEQARLHFTETPAGSVLICLPALLADRETGSDPLELSAG